MLCRKTIICGFAGDLVTGKIALFMGNKSNYRPMANVVYCRLVAVEWLIMSSCAFLLVALHGIPSISKSLLSRRFCLIHKSLMPLFTGIFLSREFCSNGTTCMCISVGTHFRIYILWRTVFRDVCEVELYWEIYCRICGIYIVENYNAEVVMWLWSGN